MQFDSFHTEQDLIAAFRAENRAAAGVIFKHYHPALVRFADQIIDNNAEAQDIVKEVFIKLIRKSKDFENLANIKSFLYTATRNACYDYVAHSKVRKRGAVELMYLTDTLEESSLDFSKIDDEIMNIVVSEIEKFPARRRDVLLLQLVKNFDANRIAGLLGLSVKTVYKHNKTGIKQIQAALSKKGFTFNESPLYVLVLSTMLLFS